MLIAKDSPFIIYSKFRFIKHLKDFEWMDENLAIDCTKIAIRYKYDGMRLMLFRMHTAGLFDYLFYLEKVNELNQIEADIICELDK